MYKGSHRRTPGSHLSQEDYSNAVKLNSTDSDGSHSFQQSSHHLPAQTTHLLNAPVLITAASRLCYPKRYFSKEQWVSS